MATAYPNEEINITINENLITCQICMERFDSPRILSCQHTFCKKCIETIINKNCLGNHECGIFHCPVCRRKCKIGKGRKDMDVIMKAFPENRLMNDLIEGMKRSETETHTVAFSYNDTESSRHPSEKVQQCLWSYHCFLLLFKQYMEAIIWIRLWKSQGQALHNTHINRKLTAMFSDIVLSTFYNNSLVKYTHEFSTPFEHTVLRHMSFNDRMREIENIQGDIEKDECNFCDGDQQTFMADMSKSNWTQLKTNQYQQTDAESLSLFLIGYWSLGFSNLFSLTTLLFGTFLNLKLWPIHFMILGQSNMSQFRTVLIGTVRILGSIFLSYISGLFEWWSLMSIVSSTFMAYLWLWVFPRFRSMHSVHMQNYDILTGEIRNLKPFGFSCFTLVGKIFHSTVYIENFSRLFFISNALYKFLLFFSISPIVWYILYDIVTEILNYFIMRTETNFLQATQNFNRRYFISNISPRSSEEYEFQSDF